MSEPERERADYRVPECCERCASNDLVFRVIYDIGMAKYVCMNCGFTRGLPKMLNPKLRYSNALVRMCKKKIAGDPHCTICGSTENLEAHHIIPVSHAKEYSLVESNLVTLCRKCHMLVHHNPNRKECADD